MRCPSYLTPYNKAYPLIRTEHLAFHLWPLANSPPPPAFFLVLILVVLHVGREFSPSQKIDFPLFLDGKGKDVRHGAGSPARGCVTLLCDVAQPLAPLTEGNCSRLAFPIDRIIPDVQAGMGNNNITVI